MFFVIALIIGLVIALITIYLIISLGSNKNNNNQQTSICREQNISPFVPPRSENIPLISNSKPKYPSWAQSPISPNCLASNIPEIEQGFRPLPTNNWLTSFLEDLPLNNDVLIYPYYIALLDQGIYLSYPFKALQEAQTNNTIVAEVKQGQRLYLGCNFWDFDLAPSLAYYDELSATLVFLDKSQSQTDKSQSQTDKSQSKTGNPSLIFPLVQGSPYVTAVYQGFIPVISSLLDGSQSEQEIRAKLKLTPNDGRLHDYYVITINEGTSREQKYHLLANPGIVLTLIGDYTIQGTNDYQGYLRLFLEDSPEQVTLLTTKQYWSCYPKGINTLLARGNGNSNSNAGNINSNNSNGPTNNSNGLTNNSDELTFRWDFLTNNIGQLVMIALPHQNNLSGITRTGISLGHPLIAPGEYVVGNSWILTETPTDIGFLPSVDITIDPYYTDLLKQWQSDIGLLDQKQVITLDFDNTIRQLAGQANLFLVGEALGQRESQLFNQSLDNFIAQVDTLINPNKGYFFYDVKWGGLIYQPNISAASDGINSGNIFFNCHQVQYGYLLYTLAVIGNYNSDYLTNNKELVLSFIRDIANPNKKDPYFCLWRAKNWYLGHSIDIGLLHDNKSYRSQQAIMETINSYYAIYLLALIFDDKVLNNLGQILMLSEIRASQVYFQYTSFQPPLITVVSSFDTVSTINYWSDVIYAYTSYSNTPAKPNSYPANQIAYLGPLFLPLSNVTNITLDDTWISLVVPLINQSLAVTDLNPGWQAFAYMLLSFLSSAPSYWTPAESLPPDQLILGNTKSYTLYWILVQIVRQTS